MYRLSAASDWWNFAIIVLGAVVSIMVLLPWLLLLQAPLVLVMIKLTHYFVMTSRQLKRLEGTTRSPVYQVEYRYPRDLMQTFLRA